MRLLRFVLPASLLLVLPWSSRAQTGGGPPKSDLSVDAKLVIVPATVRDKKGGLIGGLKKEAFQLQVDGKAQTIRYFDRDSNEPLTLGLLIDTSLSQRTVLDAERTASSAFLDKMLTPDRDKAFVEQFARRVELLQDVTASRPKLQQALKEVDVEKPSFQRPNNGDDNSGSGNGSDDRRERVRDMLANAGTALYDAVFLASDEVLAKQQGRRALILLTDGADHGSKVTLVRAIESAQRANTIVYAIYYKGEKPKFERPGGRGGFPGGGRRGGGGGFPGGGRFPLMGQGRGGYEVDGKKVLERLCGETGGRVYEVTKKQSVDAIYGQIAEELRAQYRLGFTPGGDAAAEGYHQIVLDLAGADAKGKNTVQTRDGYYTGAGK